MAAVSRPFAEAGPSFLQQITLHSARTPCAIWVHFAPYFTNSGKSEGANLSDVLEDSIEVAQTVNEQ